MRGLAGVGRGHGGAWLECGEAWPVVDVEQVSCNYTEEQGKVSLYFCYAFVSFTSNVKV